MRKMMTKEVTKTNVKVGKVVVNDGKLEAVELPDEVILGNVSLEKAQKIVDKKYEEKVTVFNVQPETVVYEMPVEDFIKYASVKDDSPEENNTQDSAGNNTQDSAE